MAQLRNTAFNSSKLNLSLTFNYFNYSTGTWKLATRSLYGTSLNRTWSALAGADGSLPAWNKGPLSLIYFLYAGASRSVAESATVPGSKISRAKFGSG